MNAANHLQFIPVLKVSIALIVGILIGNHLRYTLPLWAWAVVMVVCIGFAFISKAYAKLQGSCVLFAFAAWGAMLLQVKQQQQAVNLPTTPQVSKGIVLTMLKESRKTIQCDLYIVKGALCGHKVKASILKDTLTQQYKTLSVGKAITYCAAHMPLQNFYTTSNFNYRRWMQQQGYVAQIFITKNNWQYCSIDISQLPRMLRLRLLAQKVRLYLVDMYSIRGHIQQDEAIVSAITLGDKRGLAPTTKKVFSVSGASHILALSGLHLGMLFGMLCVLFGIGKSRPLLPMSMVILTIWIYVFLTGMSPSLLRSALMLTLYTLISSLHRDGISLNALAFAAVVMLMFNPLLLWDIGFQLSFVSVLSIIILYPPIYSWLSRVGLHKFFVYRWLSGMVAVSLAAQIATAPLTAYYFGRFSCYFLLTNIIAVPLTMCVLYVACVFFVCGWIPMLQSVVREILIMLSGLLNGFLTWVASLPHASIEGIKVNTLQVCMVYVIMVCLMGVTYLFCKNK